jgi:hypothetical protein
MPNDIQSMIHGLSDGERANLLHELLVPYLRNLDTEVCVLDDAGEVVGYLMCAAQRDQLIPTELLDSLESASYKRTRKPNAEVLVKLPATVCS